MAASVEAATQTANTAAGTTVVLATPGTPTTAKYLLAVIFNGWNNAAGAITAPVTSPTWTLLGTSAFSDNVRRVSILGRPATGSEPSTHTFTIPDASGVHSGAMLLIAGTDPAQAVSTIVFSPSASAADGTAPSISTTQADTLLIAGIAKPQGSTWTPPAGMAEHVDLRTGVGTGDRSLTIASAVLAAAGASGTRTFTEGGGLGSDIYLSFSLGVNPTGAGTFGFAEWDHLYTTAAVVNPAPTGFSDTPGDGQVTLAWNANTNLAHAGWRIYRDGILIASPVASATSFTVTGLTNAVPYTFALAWITSAGVESARASLTSTPVATPTTSPPAAPTTITGSASSGQVVIDVPDVVGATNYRLWQNGTPTATSTTSTFTVTGLTNGTIYTFWVTALGPGGESAASPSIQLVPLAASDSTPPGTQAAGTVTVAKGVITLTWPANPAGDLAGYRVTRDGSVVATLPPATRTYADPNTNQGITHTYSIAAYDTSGNVGNPWTVSATEEGFPTSHERLTLDGIELDDNSPTGYILESLSITPPSSRAEWVTGADADGAALVRDPLFENREITVGLRAWFEDMDDALRAIGVIVDKLRLASSQPQGIPLVWSPAGTTASLTFRVLEGAITDMPVAPDSGWFQTKPLITLRLTCEPDGRGTEVEVASGTETKPALIMDVTGVPGDLPALGRLVVTEGAGRSRRFLEYGVEHEPDSTTPLILDSYVLLTTGFAGTGTTRTGAYDARPGGGRTVLRARLYASPQAVCGTGTLGHIGAYRVKARIYADNTGVSLRLVWREGEGLWRRLPAVALPSSGGFFEVDLGQVSVAGSIAGLQSWSAYVEAWSTTPGAQLDVNYLVLVPASDSYGRSVASYSYSSGVTTVVDAFEGLGTGALNGSGAPAGGTWTTSGGTGDFNGVAHSGRGTVAERTVVSASSPRFAILGSTVFTDVEVGIQTYFATLGEQWLAEPQVIARWIDSSNYLAMKLSHELGFAYLVQVIGGTATIMDQETWGSRPREVWYGLRLVVYASGRVIGDLLDPSGSMILRLQATHTTLVAGGVLASGRVGFSDRNSNSFGFTALRRYDAFYAGVPQPEPVVLHPSRTLEIGDDILRESAGGSVYGRPPSAFGPRLRLQPGASRVLVKASRNDITTTDDGGVGDAIQARLFVTPRFLAIPRPADAGFAALSAFGEPELSAFSGPELLMTARVAPVLEIGQAFEVELAQAISARQTPKIYASFGQAEETEMAQPITRG